MSELIIVFCGVIFFLYLNILGKTLFYLLEDSECERDSFKNFYPIFGLAFMTLVSTYTCLLSVPFRGSAIYISGFLLIVAVSVLLKKLINSKTKKVPTYKEQVYSRLPIIVGALFVTLPFLIGGYDFVILRGNGTDSFNYVTQADALLNYSYRWILEAPSETLAETSPSLPLAQQLLQSRFSTSALLAFASGLLQISPIKIEYVFTLVLSLLLIPTFSSVLKYFFGSRWFTDWIPVVFVTGFWGQFILDLRAFSHIAAYPIAVTLIGLCLYNFKSEKKFFSAHPAIFAILTIALWLHYPEICLPLFPIFIAAIIPQYIEIYKDPKKRHHAKKEILLFFCICLLLLLPTFNNLFNFLKTQISFATAPSLGWEKAYFSWLREPVTGLWGMGSTLGLNPLLDQIIFYIGQGSGIILSFGALFVGVNCIKQLSSKAFDPFIFITSFGLVLYLTAYYYLIAKNNPWSAGKLTSFFSFLPVFYISQIIADIKNNTWFPFLNKVRHLILVAIAGWGVFNVSFAAIRIVYSVKKTDFKNYVLNHGEYRRVGAKNLFEISNLNISNKVKISIIDPNPWAREFYCKIFEGNNYKVKTPFFLKLRDEMLKKSWDSEKIKDVFGRQSAFINTEVFNNAYYYKENLNKAAAVLKIENQYGIEETNNKNFIFLGSSPSKVYCFSNNESYFLKLNVQSLFENKNKLKIKIYVNNIIAYAKETIKDPTTIEYKVNLKKGFQELMIVCENPNAVTNILGSDTRNLLFKITFL